MGYLIGADPEVFVQDKDSLQFVNAHNLVPGDKEHPFKVPLGAVQVDGMALEFNIDPAATREEFLRNIKGVYHELQTMVPQYNLVNAPYAVFDKGYFEQQPAASKVLGCDPDYNAYTGDKNNPPNGDQPARTASGHIHVGWTEGVDPFDPVHFADCQAVIKQLDSTLGVLSPLWDSDKKRKSMYGKAGAFRPKPYGAEYRVLSNAWLNSDYLIGYVYDVTNWAMEKLDKGVQLDQTLGWGDMRDYMDGPYHDAGEARYYYNDLRRYDKSFPVFKKAA